MAGAYTLPTNSFTFSLVYTHFNEDTHESKGNTFSNDFSVGEADCITSLLIPVFLVDTNADFLQIHQRKFLITYISKNKTEYILPNFAIIAIKTRSSGVG